LIVIIPQHINTLCEQNAVFNLEARGAYSYRLCFKGLIWYLF